MQARIAPSAVEAGMFGAMFRGAVGIRNVSPIGRHAAAGLSIGNATPYPIYPDRGGAPISLRGADTGRSVCATPTGAACRRRGRSMIP